MPRGGLCCCRAQVLPLKNVERTLVIADTGGLHCRGQARAPLKSPAGCTAVTFTRPLLDRALLFDPQASSGTTRRTLRPMGAQNDGGVKRLNPFRESSEL